MLRCQSTACILLHFSDKPCRREQNGRENIQNSGYLQVIPRIRGLENQRDRGAKLSEIPNSMMSIECQEDRSIIEIDFASKIK